MKIQSRLVVLISFVSLLFVLACGAGGAAGSAPTPTLITLPNVASDGGMVATQPDAGQPVSGQPDAGQTAAPPGAGVAQGGTVPICSLLTNDEAAAVLGAPVTGSPREGGETGRKFLNCEYVVGAQGLTLQGGSAEQGKELLMAAAHGMQTMKASPDEQKVIDDTAANLPGLTLQQVFDRISPQYNSHCFVISDLPAAGNAAKWITCPAAQYTAVLMQRGTSEDQLSFLDIVWTGSSLDEASQQVKLVGAVNTALARLPAGATTVLGN